MRNKIYEEINEVLKMKSKNKKNDSHHNQAILYMVFLTLLSSLNCASARLAMIHNIQTHNVGRNKFQPGTLAGTLITVADSQTHSQQ